MMIKNAPRNVMRLITITSVLTVLSIMQACSGGGGGSSTNVRPSSTGNNVTVVPPPITTPDQNDPATFRTAEFYRSYNLGAIGAEYAYAEGLTGSGVTIGILDFNFDFSSTEVNYVPGSVGANQIYIDMYEAQTGDTAANEPHGHAVAVFAAGARNTIDTHMALHLMPGYSQSIIFPE